MYSAILSLALLDVPELYSKIDIDGIERFLISCKGSIPGSYHIHEMGEIDMRCTFAAVMLNKMLGINNPLINQGVEDYVLSCQGYEGGISPIPGVEAHGGYTFCGVAAMSLLGKLQNLDLKKLLYWVSKNQTEYGGFCGRTTSLLIHLTVFGKDQLFNNIGVLFFSLSWRQA